MSNRDPDSQPPEEAEERRRRRRFLIWWFLGAAGAVVVIIVLVVAFTGGGGDEDPKVAATPTKAVERETPSSTPAPTSTPRTTSTPRGGRGAIATITPAAMPTATATEGPRSDPAPRRSTATPTPSAAASPSGSPTASPTATPSPTPTAPVVLDISGRWDIVVVNTITTGACAGESGDSGVHNATIAQDGTTLTVFGFGTTSRNSWPGMLDGTTVTFNGTRAEDNGTTTASFTLEVDPVTWTMVGAEAWTWVGPGGSCPGSASDVTGERVG